MSKPIVLLGDLGLDHEGYPPTPVISGSPDVMVDGKPAARVGDQLAMHSKPFHPPHPRTIAEGSSTVMINGVPAAITGGKVSCGGVTIGSGSVVIGDSPAPAAFSGSTPLPARKAPASAEGQNSTTTSSPSQARSPSPAQPSLPKTPAGPGGSSSTSEAAASDNASTEIESQKQGVEPGFHVVRQPMKKADLIAHLYGDPSLKPDRFDALNPGLGQHVLPGQMVVMADPDGLQCTAEEEALIAAAKEVNARASTLSEAEAQFLTDNFDLIATITSTSAAGMGAGSVMISRQLKGIEHNLRELEALHQESYRKHGNLSNPEFFEKRRAIFKRLDFALGKLARKGLSLDTSDKLKRALGLSSKSIVHDWKQAGVGEIPGYATHYERVSRAGKYMARTGYLAIALDASVSALKVSEACKSGRAEECRVVVYQEAGRMSGSIIGGTAGGAMAGFCAVAGLATGGVPGIACAVLVGGTMSVVGGKQLGDLFADGANILREVIHE